MASLVSFEGLDEIQEELKKLSKAKQIVKGYDVGFFESAKYSNGTKVASVAFWNEFGTSRPNKKKDGEEIKIPERPFFRNANEKASKTVAKLIRKFLTQSKKLILDLSSVSKIAIFHQKEIQSSIRDLSEPKNAESTIKRKGVDNPLIDTGFMRKSVTFKVIK